MHRENVHLKELGKESFLLDAFDLKRESSKEILHLSDKLLKDNSAIITVDEATRFGEQNEKGEALKEECKKENLTSDIIMENILIGVKDISKLENISTLEQKKAVLFENHSRKTKERKPSDDPIQEAVTQMILGEQDFAVRRIQGIGYDAAEHPRGFLDVAFNEVKANMMGPVTDEELNVEILEQEKAKTMRLTRGRARRQRSLSRISFDC